MSGCEVAHDCAVSRRSPLRIDDCGICPTEPPGLPTRHLALPLVRRQLRGPCELRNRLGVPAEPREKLAADAGDEVEAGEGASASRSA